MIVAARKWRILATSLPPTPKKCGSDGIRQSRQIYLKHVSLLVFELLFFLNFIQCVGPLTKQVNRIRTCSNTADLWCAGDYASPLKKEKADLCSGQPHGVNTAWKITQKLARGVLCCLPEQLFVTRIDVWNI